VLSFLEERGRSTLGSCGWSFLLWDLAIGLCILRLVRSLLSANGSEGVGSTGGPQAASPPRRAQQEVGVESG
jgi:hypothetical protein